jgi:bifunctional DNA-binding transcriptional regulator/antitoxin component of YhaV-PrlF toxin-antitoxin module
MARAIIDNSYIPIPKGLKKIFPFKNGEEVEIKIKKRKEVIITRPKLSESIVDKYFGIWKNHEDIPNSKEYVRAIRKGWGKRLKRMGIE